MQDLAYIYHLTKEAGLQKAPRKGQKSNSASYSKRNAIIHRGENATEDEATQALAVARRIVQIMGEI